MLCYVAYEGPRREHSSNLSSQLKFFLSPNSFLLVYPDPEPTVILKKL